MFESFGYQLLHRCLNLIFAVGIGDCNRSTYLYSISLMLLFILFGLHDVIDNKGLFL